MGVKQFVESARAPVAAKNSNTAKQIFRIMCPFSLLKTISARCNVSAVVGQVVALEQRGQPSRGRENSWRIRAIEQLAWQWFNAGGPEKWSGRAVARPTHFLRQLA